MHLLQKLIQAAALAWVATAAAVQPPRIDSSVAASSVTVTSASHNASPAPIVAGSVPTINGRTEDDQADADERDAMATLEAGTFTVKDSPTNNQVYSSWKLHLCVQDCTLNKAADPVHIFGHTSVVGIPFDEITFEMCNRAFVNCNVKCQQEYTKQMIDWPPAGTTWETSTSSYLSTCLSTCNAAAANDDELITAAEHAPKDMERDASFALCNQKLSRCTDVCQRGFNDESIEFQQDQRD